MPTASEISLDSMVRAVEKVRERLLRTVAVLQKAGVPYAVVGGHAVAAWVSTIDEAAVRNTRDVDILIRRADLPLAITAMERAGFVYRHVAGVDVFLEGEQGSVRDAVKVVFSGEKVREHEPEPNPVVEDSEESEFFRVISLDALIRIKLTAFRLKDQVHLQDLLSLGLIDLNRSDLSPELSARLRHVIEASEAEQS